MEYKHVILLYLSTFSIQKCVGCFHICLTPCMYTRCPASTVCAGAVPWWRRLHNLSKGQGRLWEYFLSSSLPRPRLPLTHWLLTLPYLPSSVTKEVTSQRGQFVSVMEHGKDVWLESSFPYACLLVYFQRYFF